MDEVASDYDTVWFLFFKLLEQSTKDKAVLVMSLVET
jgi:hypothetical protein